jgi:hypothetical protein
MDWVCAQVFFRFLQVNRKAGGYVLTAEQNRFDFTDPTLMASRWFMNFGRDTAGAITEPVQLAMGLIAWSDHDGAPPIEAELPGPLSDCNLDWINRYVITFPATTVSNPSDGPGPTWDNTHLSKAKRRLGNDRGLLLVFEAGSETSSVIEQFNATVDVRCLIKE